MRFAFRDLRTEKRAEAVTEATANAAVVYERLFQPGKVDVAYPSALARFATAQYRAGRRVGARLNVNDVTDLGKLLPHELNDSIVAAGRYPYRLDLPPDAIAVLVHEDDELHEESGSPLDRELFAAAQRPSRRPTVQE